MNNEKELLPSVQPVPTQNKTSCDVIAFDFVPQLLKLLQNCKIMIQDNLVIDMQICFNNTEVIMAQLVKLSPDPYTVRPIPSLSNTQNGNCAFPSFNGSIAHLWLEMTDFHSCHTCLRTQYSWRSFVRGLKPGGTTAFFPNHAHCRHRIKFNRKATTFKNTMRNYWLLFCKHLKSAIGCLRNVTLPIGPTGQMTVDVKTCILFIIRYMQEAVYYSIYARRQQLCGHLWLTHQKVNVNVGLAMLIMMT